MYVQVLGINHKKLRSVFELLPDMSVTGTWSEPTSKIVCPRRIFPDRQRASNPGFRALPDVGPAARSTLRRHTQCRHAGRFSSCDYYGLAMLVSRRKRLSSD